MKNVFVPHERHTESGKLFTDAEGCSYLKPHSHDLLKGKEFANPAEMAMLIADHNNANPQNKFTGEVILLNILTY